MGLHTASAARSLSTFLSTTGLTAAGALLLVACPTTERCPSGQLWYPDEEVCRVPDGEDGGVDAGDGGEANDASCAGTCTSPQVCDLASGLCVACNDDTDCSSTDRGAACIDHVCYACEDSADCPSLEAPECNGAHECTGCTGPDACADRSGTTLCGASGACVACTAADESACGTDVCDVEMGVCTAVPERSAAACEPCVSDRQCALGQLCVPNSFPVLGGTEVGNRCAWRQDAVEGPMGDCTRVVVRPYVRALPLTSVGGTATSMCVPSASTCDALADFRSSLISCTATLPTPDDLCGAEGFDDGFCRGGRCTVGCVTSDDCPCTDLTCARQYRCRTGACEFDCECPTGGGACVGACP